MIQSRFFFFANNYSEEILPETREEASLRLENLLNYILEEKHSLN